MIITRKGATESIIAIEEIFRAPKEKAFKAWTTPESLKKWFMADEGVIVTDAKVDLKIGGAYLIEAKFPGYDPTPIDGNFLKVLIPERLEYTWLTPVLNGRKTLVAVEFINHGNGSKIHLNHGEFANKKEMKLHLKGWEACLGKLQEYLEP